MPSYSIYEMCQNLCSLYKSGKYNDQYVDLILKNISCTSSLGCDFMEGMSLMMPFHMQLNLFTIPTWEWVNKLSYTLKGRKTAEIGAGTALLSVMLQTMNIDVTPIDNFDRKIEPFIPVRRIDFLTMDISEYDAYIIGWPEMNCSCTKLCKKIHKYNVEHNTNKLIIYIGEQEWGCTADDSFFQSFFIIPADVNYTPLPGLHDDVYFVHSKTIMDASTYDSIDDSTDISAKSTDTSNKKRKVSIL